MMLEFILVRHGECYGNQRGAFVGWTDSELSKTGIEQSYAIKEKLFQPPIDAVFTSPLKRAFQTAEIINQPHGLTIKPSDSIKERGFGSWENHTLAEIKVSFPLEAKQWLADPSYPIPGGENIEHFYRRIKSFTNELLQSYSHGRILLVTHGGCIRIILAHLLGLDNEECWRFKINVGGITKVEVNDEHFAYLTMLNG